MYLCTLSQSPREASLELCEPYSQRFGAVGALAELSGERS